MNKETVSHYGWIVVLSLVMAVLIAFTTPMGKYVGMAASNIIRGFGRTNINAMSDKNINDMQQKWQDKIDELDNNMIKTNLKQNGKIPSNTTYKKADGTTLSGNNGDSYPSSPSDGDFVVFENTYKYTYSADENGWSMITINKDLNVYPGIFTQIANKDIVSLQGAFKDCINMIQSPAIPSTVKNLNSTFYGCTSLKGDIIIDIAPSGSVYNYNGMFGGRTLSSPYITITGSLSDTLKKALANTGENVRYLDSSGILRDKNGNAVSISNK